MTKADIVTEISNKTGIDRNDVLAIVEGFMGTVKNAMENGENVYLRGFGSLWAFGSPGICLRGDYDIGGVGEHISVFFPTGFEDGRS